MHTRGAQWNGVGARGRGAGRVGAALGASNGGNGKIAATRTLAHTFSRLRNGLELAISSGIGSRSRPSFTLDRPCALRARATVCLEPLATSERFQVSSHHCAIVKLRQMQ